LGCGFVADHGSGLALYGLDGGCFAQLELQTPAIVADFGVAPGFERAYISEMRADFHRHETLAGLLAEADYGVERSVCVQVLVG
jgi:hypothetical protein